MDHRFSHSRRWKRQRALSVKKICLEKGDLAEFIGASCGQERYFFLTEFYHARKKKACDMVVVF
jgi:hypothetical protein